LAYRSPGTGPHTGADADARTRHHENRSRRHHCPARTSTAAVSCTTAAQRQVAGAHPVRTGVATDRLRGPGAAPRL